MPQFNLSGASLSAGGLTKIKTAEKYIPFVYDDGYPIISTTGVSYADSDPKASGASTNFISDFYGRIPYDPDFHKQIRGTLTVGYGTTLDGKPGKDTLFHQVYTDGISIGGTTYTFPVQFLEANATNSTGGYYKNESNTQVTDAPITLKYTGNDSSNSTKVMNATLASSLLEDKLATYVAKVKSVFNGNEDAFPYDNTLAQQHFDMMVAICYHQGTIGFEHSFFVNRYKLVDGSAVTGVGDLTDYNDAAYALMWLAAVGHEGTYYWVKPQIDRRNNDIDELVGTAGSRTFPTGLNPIVKPDWYQGADIPVEYFENQKNIDLGLDGSIGARNSTSRTIMSQEQQSFVTPAVDFHTGSLSALVAAGIATDFVDYYTGNRSIYSTEPGSADFYKNDPLYQKYYSKFWQPNEKFYHGADVVGSPRTATNHGAVFSANPDGQTPAFIIGLNEDGAGTSKVFMRSSLSQSNISSGTDTTIWDIADGKSLGSIDYGQWNHFAIARDGNIFRTFKNGTKVSEWTSPKAVTRSTRDGTLKFSIGRSQGSDYYKGYIDDFRVTKGSALYTSNFTAPTAALTTTSTTGLYNGEHYVESVYSAINKVSEQLGTEYRVNTDGTLDAGLKTVIFQGHGTAEPPAIIVRDSSGEDPSITGLTPEQITAQFDAEDYVSGVELLSQTQGSSQQADHAEAFDSNTPYRDLYGAKLERVQFVAENSIPNVQRQDRALSYLNEFKKVKKSISLSLEEYEIQGDFNVGDMIYVYDPEIRFEDTEAKRIEDGRDSLYEVAYRGQIINPEKIRITGITWPIKSGYGVYLRKVASTEPYRVEYIDLTDYISWERGQTQLDIGDLSKRIGEDMRLSGAVTGVVSGTRQTSVRKPKHPDTGVEGNLKLTSATLDDDLGVSRAIIYVQWMEPTYDNGSPVQNGLQYQVEWKPTNTTGDWSSSFINWDSTNDFTIEGLQLNTTYNVRVTAILTNANSSDPATGSVTTAIDTDAPSKPAQATTISAGGLRVQIIHNLARVKDDDGNVIGSPTNFTLQRDIDHLNVYASTSSGFPLSNATQKAQYKVGQLPVSASHIKHEIPLVGEIQVANGSTHYWRFTAVDNAGNESEPSDEQSASGNLIETSMISDLAVSNAKIGNLAVNDAKVADLSAGKITAGTIAGQTIIVGTNTSDSSIIKSSNYSAGSAGWAIKSDGSLEASSGNFRGDITGASGTFSGALSAATGTFEGNISGASGTFTGDLSGSNISGGTIDIGGSDSTSFHVDTDGNMWLGAATFGSAPFKVSNAGALTATSVTASDVFVSGVAITPSLLTSGVNMDDTSTLTSNFTTSGSGKFRTASSGARVEVASTYGPEVRFFNSAGSDVGRVADDSGTLVFRTGTSNDMFIHSYDELHLSATNVINFGAIIGGTNRPLIKIGGNGDTSKVLGVDSNGLLEFQNIDTSGGGHDHDSDYYTKDANDLLLQAKAGVSHGTHVGSTTAVTGAKSGTAGDTAVTGEITIASGGAGGGFIVGNTTRSGNTITVGAGVNGYIGQAWPTGSTKKIGVSSTNRYTSIYSSGFYGTFYGQNINASSKNIKENIEDTALGLDFLNDLEVKDFTMIDTDTFGSKKYTGFIAEDIQKYLDDNDLDYKLTEDYSGSYEFKDSCSHPIVPDFEDEDQTITYMHDTVEECEAYMPDENRHPHLYFNNFVGPLVKAVQELSTQITDLTARVEALEG